MTAHGELQAASERDAVQGRDHRLREPFDEVEHIVEVRRREHLCRAKLGHVRAPAEIRPRAREDHGGHGLRVRGTLQAFGDPLAHARAERIHRRVVEPDHGDGAV